MSHHGNTEALTLTNTHSDTYTRINVSLVILVFCLAHAPFQLNTLYRNATSTDRHVTYLIIFGDGKATSVCFTTGLHRLRNLLGWYRPTVPTSFIRQRQEIDTLKLFCSLQVVDVAESWAALIDTVSVYY